MNFLAELGASRTTLKKAPKPKEKNVTERLATLGTRNQADAIKISYTDALDAHAAAGFSGATPTAQNTAKVLVLQRNCVDASELDRILSQDKADTSRAADFVVLPEGAHHEGGAATLEGNALLRSLAAVVRKHACWAVLGTMGELVRSITCCVNDRCLRGVDAFTAVFSLLLCLSLTLCLGPCLSLTLCLGPCLCPCLCLGL